MNDMKKILTSELKLGVKFDQPVFIDAYNMLLGAGQAIQQEDLDSLRKWGIQEIKTHGEILASLASLEAKQKESAVASNGTAAISNYEKELLLLKYKNQYESLRKKASVFPHDLRENCALLENSFKAFLSKGIPQSHNIEQVADSLTENIINFPLLVVFLRYSKFNSNRIICHLVHSTAYGILLAKGLGYSKMDIRNIATAMLTMDLGMFTIPSSIREKDKTLEAEEIKLIKKHPLISHRLLYSASSTKSIRISNIALQHHEAYDGSGYPRGLKGKNIDQDAMLAKICDVYTAMIEERPFRKRFLPYVALKNMLSNSAKRFDPDILRVFIKEMSIYPVGSFVKLNNSCIAMVIAIHPQNSNLPILRLMRDPQKLPYPELQFMDIAQESAIQIESPVAPASVGIDPVREL